MPENGENSGGGDKSEAVSKSPPKRRLPLWLNSVAKKQKTTNEEEPNTSVERTQGQDPPQEPSSSNRREVVRPPTPSDQEDRTRTNSLKETAKEDEEPTSSTAAESSGEGNEIETVRIKEEPIDEPVEEKHANTSGNHSNEDRDIDTVRVKKEPKTDETNDQLKVPSKEKVPQPSTTVKTEAVVKEEATSSTREMCKFGIRCYRGKHTKFGQFKELVEFMVDNPEIAKGFSKTVGKDETLSKRWDDLSMKLNSLGPPMHDAKGWKKVWADHKIYIKKKLQHNLQEEEKTGGGSCNLQCLTSLEETVARIADLYTAVNGVDGAKSFGLKRSAPTEFKSKVRKIRNPIHRIEEAHPGDGDYKLPDYPLPPLGTPMCPFGDRCYRRNPTHFAQFSHPPATNFKKNWITRQLRLRKKANASTNNTSFSDDDEYDLDDPFINDEEDDADFVPSDDEEDFDEFDDGSDD